MNNQAYRRMVETKYLDQALLLAQSTLQDCRRAVSSLSLYCQELEQENDRLRNELAELKRSIALPAFHKKPETKGGLSID